jgi:uncharacterized membrane protein (DUF4010 family)
MSNFVFKFGIVSILAHRSLVLRVATAFGVALACGAMILWLWPS